MQRITISIADDLLEAVDQIVVRRGYGGRSEALRDMVREQIQHDQLADLEDFFCYATLTYVYEHDVRHLPERLADVGHHHHDLTVSTLHVHVSHAHCLEVVVLRGNLSQVRAYADAITTQRGVTQGRLHVVAAEPHPRAR